ncbi:hypothetical protein CBS101457_003930 [Exobasidium rhododendri]|nr:hypothetical protein CBS101457_003930 [Exobasidium rhododendri]
MEAAAQQGLEAMSGLQGMVAQAMQAQLEVLKGARQNHSHSDILLPPDSAAAVLLDGILQIRWQVDSYIETSYGTEKEREDAKAIITSSLLAFEARKLVFQAMQGGSAEERLEREDAKNLFDRLDVVLNLETRGGLLDATIPLLIIEEVLERLPIEACSLHFTFIESRILDLTKGLQPGKGKGLIVLRMCNELIRRLSRPTRQHTVFAGRILSLLSSVLPLGERSGVNLRGDFNVDNKTTWEEVTVAETIAEEEDEMVTEEEKVEVTAKEKVEEEEEEAGEQNRSSNKEKEIASDEIMMNLINDSTFYVLFWKAQVWFSNPTLLFAAEDEQNVDFPKMVEDPVQDGTKTAMRSFRKATRCILSVFGAVERREKELVGKAGDKKGDGEQARGSNPASNTTELPDAGQNLDEVISKKRKLDVQDGSESNKADDAFFPKYLTGRNLFEYELRDATFRKHVLAQYLILFQYLLSFSQSQKEKAKGWRNQLLANASSKYTLEESDIGWIRDTWKEIIYLLREIPPEGKIFSDSITQILKREARWTNWKADSCPTIDRRVLSDDEIAAFARARKALALPMRSYPHTVGTAALSRLWQDGVRKPEPIMRTMENEEGVEVQVQSDGLEDLEFGPRIPSLETYSSQIAKTEEQQEKRRRELGWESPSVYFVAINMPQEKRQSERKRIERESKDETLRELEQMRILQAWRASRLARGSHLDRFSKMKIDDVTPAVGIRIDDITRLMKAIHDKEKKRDEVQGAAAAAAAPALVDAGSKRAGDVEMKGVDAVPSVDSEMAKLVKTEGTPTAEGEDEHAENVTVPKVEEKASSDDNFKEEHPNQDVDTSMQS